MNNSLDLIQFRSCTTTCKLEWISPLKINKSKFTLQNSEEQVHYQILFTFILVLKMKKIWCGACFFSQHLSYFFYQGRFFTAFIIVDSVFLWASHTCLWDLLHQKESKAYTTHFPIQVMQIYEATQLSTFVTSFQLQSLARKGWSKSPECFWAQYQN